MARKGLRYTKQEVYSYLDELRESGITNMFGAAPYIEKKFGCTRGEARRMLSEWMGKFGWKQEGDKQ